MFGFLLVATSRNTSTHRTVVQKAIPKANLPLTFVNVNAELLEENTRHCCGPDDAICGLDLQVVLGLSYGFLSCGERELSSIMCKIPRSTVYILSFDFTIGCGLDVFASSIREYPLRILHRAHECVSSLKFVKLFVDVHALCRT